MLAGTAIGEAKDSEGTVEMSRVLRAARRSAVKARAQAAKQRSQGVARHSPGGAEVGAEGALHGQTGAPGGALPSGRSPGRRRGGRQVVRPALHRTPLPGALRKDSRARRPPGASRGADGPDPLVAVNGVGTDTAATLLVAVGQDPRRLGSEAAFAHIHVRGRADPRLLR